MSEEDNYLWNKYYPKDNSPIIKEMHIPVEYYLNLKFTERDLVWSLRSDIRLTLREFGLWKVLEVLEKCVEDLATTDEDFLKTFDLSILEEKKKEIDESSQKTNTRISGIAKKYGLKLINKRSKCPFHKGDNPTCLSFNDKLNVFSCFGCGVKGDIFTFIKMMEDLKNE